MTPALTVRRNFHALAPAARPKSRRPAVFLDRDGTLIHDRPGFYLHHPDQIRFYAGVFPALRRLLDAGFELVVVSNQSGIGRGILDHAMLERVHRKFLTQLRRHGVPLAGIWFCPHHPDDKCDCRKPLPTLARKAVRRHRLTLEGSFMVGDKKADVDLARALGVPSVLVSTGHAKHQRASHGSSLKPDYQAKDLRDAARWILARSGGGAR